jgi:transcriptional antiterminator NusG
MTSKTNDTTETEAGADTATSSKGDVDEKRPQDETPDTASSTEPDPEATSSDESAGDAPAAEASDADAPDKSSIASQEGMRWYVLRVASNKEDQVSRALSRKIAIEGMEDRIGRILVPTQKEKRMRAGKVRVMERKLYPGYVFVEMETEEDGSVSENVWFMVKETTGVGDFIGSGGKPTPMRDYDVEKMIAVAERREEQPTLGIPFTRGDRVKVREGSFENYEGDVDGIDEQKGTVTVLLTIFGRATPVDVEYWLLEKI